MPIIPDEYTDLFDERAFWHIATLGPDGELQSSPVWGGFDDDHFVFSHPKGRRQYRNLEANPTIAVSGIDPDNPYRCLEMRGEVVRVDDDSSTRSSTRWPSIDADADPFHQPGTSGSSRVAGPPTPLGWADRIG